MLLWSLAASLLLISALYTDLDKGIIPNRITVTFALVGLGLNLCSVWSVAGIGLWVQGLAAGGLLFLIPYLHGAAGGGDLKLFAALGAIIGPWAVTWTFLYACVAWGLCGLLFYGRVRFSMSRNSISYNKTRSKTLPFSVPATAGFLVFVFFGGM